MLTHYHKLLPTDLLNVDTSFITMYLSLSLRVNAQDSAGIVQDGFDPQVDVDYTDEYYSISAHFRGFISEDCGGFSDFLWSVGFLDDREAVLPFTEQGIVLTGEGAGSAQVSGLVTVKEHLKYVSLS